MIKHWGNEFAENVRGRYFADDLRGTDKLHLMDDPCDFDWYYPKVLSERRILSHPSKASTGKAPKKPSEELARRLLQVTYYRTSGIRASSPGVPTPEAMSLAR